MSESLEILKTGENYTVDDSIKSYETYAFQPISGTQLNSAGQIIIRVENQDAFFHPRKSWLQVEGKLVKAAASALYGADDKVALTNNGIMHLFDNIKYELNGQEIESVYHPGQASTILGLAKYSLNFNQCPGLNQCWLVDTNDQPEPSNTGFNSRQDYIIKKPVPRGSFRFAIDLEHIFGFCEDYDKVMYGFTHTLTLVRTSSDNNAIYKNGTVAAGKVVIDKISWMLPRVDPSDGEKYKLYKNIENKETLSVGFRMRQCINLILPESPTYTWRLGVRAAPEKPRYLIIGFQTARHNDQNKNPALFDHCNLTNMYVLLNNTRYPAIDLNTDFGKYHFDNVYKNLVEFRQNYYGLDHLVSNTTINPPDYKDLFPLFVFDVSKQSERLKLGVVDISVVMTFGGNIAANTFVYGLMISDRKLKFQSDGKKMNVVF